MNGTVTPFRCNWFAYSMLVIDTIIVTRFWHSARMKDLKWFLQHKQRIALATDVGLRNIEATFYNPLFEVGTLVQTMCRRADQQSSFCYFCFIMSELWFVAAFPVMLSRTCQLPVATNDSELIFTNFEINPWVMLMLAFVVYPSHALLSCRTSDQTFLEDIMYQVNE